MKNYIIIAILMLSAFAVGRYITPKNTTDTTHAIETIKEQEDIHKNQDITKTETVTPDGKKVIVTRIQTITDTITKIKEVEKKDESKSTKQIGNILIVDLLSSLDTTKPFSLVYGAAVSNNLIGPVRIGAFGFTDGRVGVSLGLQF